MYVRLHDVTRLLVGSDGDVSALAKELQCVSRHVPGDEGARRAGLPAVLLDRDGAYQGDAPTVRTFTDLPQLIMAEWAD